MTRNEFNRAFTIADSDVSLSDDAAHLFDGFGLPDFKTVHVTLSQVAELIRWQAKQLNGAWDNDALQAVANCGRHRFNIIGADSDDTANLREALA